MTETVPVLSIIFMVVSCTAGLAIPTGLFIYYRKKNADVLPFFTGCGVMMVFALILESLAHQIVLSSPIGATIRNNIWLYAAYGGLMAGLFEESGRFIAFKTILRKDEKNVNALMYGAGHGGFEAAALLSGTMINNIIISVMINTGNTSMLTASLSGDALAQTEASFAALIDMPSYTFLIGAAERLFAVVLQLSLSVLVWVSAKKKKRLWLYPLAIFIHFLVDAVVLILASKVSTLAVEACVLFMSALAAVLASFVWKKNIS